MRTSVLNQMNQGLIVSCQALEGEPLHSSFIMGRMSIAAKEGGAKGIRANSVPDMSICQSSGSLNRFMDRTRSLSHQR